MTSISIKCSFHNFEQFLQTEHKCRQPEGEPNRNALVLAVIRAQNAPCKHHTAATMAQVIADDGDDTKTQGQTFNDVL